MWVEIHGTLLNLDHIKKILVLEEKKQMLFFGVNDQYTFEFSKPLEVSQTYFNLIETLHAEPIDGFLADSSKKRVDQE